MRDGYCRCGCGQKTRNAIKTSTQRGWIKGRPISYINGHRRNPIKPLSERFWSKVQVGWLNDCWIWLGSRDPKTGYGHIRVEDKIVLAHRVARELTLGEIPKDELVLHLCNNRICVNPNHLELGDYTRNREYMFKSGRGNPAYGERHWMAKLTESQVKELKALAKAGLPYRELADRFDTTYQNAWYIANSKTWRHLCSSEEESLV
jgi:hypothetical protein